MRKAFKRLRALLRLVREELGEETFQRENAALRDTARRLSAARDSEVMLATLDGLLEGGGRKLRRATALAELRQGLESTHARMAEATVGDVAMRGRVMVELLEFRRRAEGWPLPERGPALVEPGLQRVYRQGRRRFRVAAQTRGRDARAMHEWRKRVKDLRHQAEILQRREGPAVLGALAARPGGRARRRREQLARERKRLRRVARRADELGELLGEDHDLAMLGELIAGAGQGPGYSALPKLPERTRRAVIRELARRRRRLQRRALKLGRDLYAERPKRFTGRVRRAYALPQGAIWRAS
jgi:CHAD domain-containing protein